ncbi:MAG: M15 family metallopeptidase [Candidatus Dojkabacteria bacterium]
MLKKYDALTAVFVLIFWVLSLIVGGLYQKMRIASSSPTDIFAPFAPEYVSALDVTPPEVLALNDVDPTFYDSANVQITTNEELDVTSLAPYNYGLLDTDSGQFTYKVEVDDLDHGDNQVTLNLTDEEGNTNQHQFTIERFSINKCLLKPDREVSTFPHPNALDAIIDKYHKVSGNYYPFRLVNAGLHGLPVYGSAYLRQVALDPLKKMIGDIQKAGIHVTISSGFRNFNSQQRAYDYWKSIVGAEKANDYAAYPGHSEHHLGTTVDLLTNENGLAVGPSFDNTKLGTWLRKNAFKYGFTMSYPKGKKNITGYSHEGWHWRYIGPKHAAEIKKLKISPTEYLYNLHSVTCD